MGRGRHRPQAEGASNNRPRPAGTPGLLDATRLLACEDSNGLLDTALELALRITVRGPLPARRRAFLYRLREDGWLRLTGRLDLTEEQLSPYRLVAPDAELPVARAVREGRPVLNVLQDVADPYVQEGDEDAIEPAQYYTLPLYSRGRCMGGVVYCLPVEASLGDGERTLLGALSELLAERLRLMDAESDVWGPPAGPGPPAAGNRLPHGRQSRTATGAGPGSPAQPPRDPRSGLPSRLERLIRADSRRPRSNLDPMVDMALSNAGIGSFDWDFPSGRLVLDERLCRLYGLNPEEFDGRIEAFYDRIHPDDLPGVQRALSESRRTGHYKAQYRVLPPGGGLRHVEAESRVIFSPEGDPCGMVGVARDRTHDVRRAEHNQRRQDFVMRVTRGFTAASSTAEIVSLMAETVMPTIRADRMAVLLHEPGDPHRVVGLRSIPEEHAVRLVDAVQRLVVDQPSHPLARGRTLLLDRAQFEAAFASEGVGGLPGEQAWLIMPLSTADGLRGTCVLSFDEPQNFTSEDEAITTAVAGILAQSLGRTRLFDERRSQLTEIQESMLPQRIPELPGLEVAVGYRPGSRGLMVGGDWYDTLKMPDGRVSVVIGDVQGHNVKAAAVMGQLRTLMRAFAAEGNRLGGLLAQVNRALYHMDTDLFATCTIVEIDAASGAAQIVRAGHPYPLLVDNGGRVREVEAEGGMPLGCFPEDDYPVSDLPLPEGGALLLFTDGLVENTGMEYDAALGIITGTLARWGRRTGPAAALGQEELDRLAEEVISSTVDTVDTPHLDDVAVLLVRRPGMRRGARQSPERGSADAGS